MLTIDPVPAFIVSNEGQGGPDRYDRLPNQTREQFDVTFNRVEAYVKTLPKVHDFGETFDPTLETVVGDPIQSLMARR